MLKNALITKAECLLKNSTHKIVLLWFLWTAEGLWPVYSMWQGKFGGDLHIKFYDKTELKQHCQAIFSIISNMLHAMEGGVSKTVTNYSYIDKNQ